MRVLAVNAGSSSLKLSLLDEDDRLLLSSNLSSSGGQLDEEALRAEVEPAGPIDAVGHRIVHGGSEFVEPILIDEPVLRRLEALVDLAPLHQPKSLRALALVSLRIVTCHLGAGAFWPP